LIPEFNRYPMKKILIPAFLLLITSSTLFAQQGVGENSEQQSAELKTGEDLAAENLKKCDNLLEWVDYLKKQSTEKAFIQRMNNFQTQLLSIKMTALEDKGTADEIGKIAEAMQKDADALAEKNQNSSKEDKLLNKGMESLRANDLAAAEKAGDQLMRDYPNYSGGYYLKGMVANAVGNDDEILRYFTIFISINPSYAYAYYFRGWAYSRSGLYEKSIQDFTSFIELEPKETDGYYGRGYARWKKKEFAESNEDYLQVIAIDSTHSGAMNNVGWNFIQMEENEAAIIWLDKSLALDKNDGNTWDSRGVAKFNLKDYEGAIADLNESIRLDPEPDNSYYYRGKAYLALGQKEKACADWKMALELGKRETQELINANCK
jgi:tetratricopeptide (TPR) repeat protein